MSISITPAPGGGLDPNGPESITGDWAFNSLSVLHNFYHQGSSEDEFGFFGHSNTEIDPPYLLGADYEQSKDFSSGPDAGPVDTDPATLAAYGFTEAQANQLVSELNFLRGDVLALGGVFASVLIELGRYGLLPNDD